MKCAHILLPLAAFSLSACNPMDLFFPEDKRLGNEAEEICVGRVRAKMTYEEYQELENAPGRFVPSYTYDITRLDLEAIQALIAKGADDTAGTRLMQQMNSTSAAVEAFKRMKVDRQGALFLGRDPSLYRVQGRAQPANTILASGCAGQMENTRLREVTWVKAGRAAPTKRPESSDPEPQGEAMDVPNLGGVR